MEKEQDNEKEQCNKMEPSLHGAGAEARTTSKELLQVSWNPVNNVLDVEN
jgi:hypothetical protein